MTDGPPHLSTAITTDGVRFGRTLLVPVLGELAEQSVDALVSPANRRGVMGVGAAGAIRLAGGAEIERQAMAQAPLTIGTAIATDAGNLAASGVRLVIHAVVSDALGSSTRVDIVQKAATALLEVADRHRIRSLAIPPLGAGLGSGRLSTREAWVTVIEETVSYLRRFTSRLERVHFVTRFDDEVLEMQRLLEEAREHFWGVRA